MGDNPNAMLKSSKQDSVFKPATKLHPGSGAEENELQSPEAKEG
jgi:hypothetical protein